MTIPDMFRTCSCASSARRRSIRPALLVAATCLVPATALAQVTVNSATTGPIYGGGSSVTVTLSGTVTGNGDPGVVSTGTSVTTSVTNDGAILANGYLGYADGWAVWANGAAIGSITNNGLIDGEVRGVSIDNDGVSAVTTLTNNAGAVINGGLQMAIYNGNVLGTVVNSGTITGANGIYSLVTTGTIDNRAGGWLQGGKAIDVDGGTVGTITNAGTIYGGKGLFISASASVGTVDNGGSFLGLGDFAVFASGTLGTLTNSGTFAGTGGIASLAGVDSITNQAGGKIEGRSVEGLFLSGSAGTITNDSGATITGAFRGVAIVANTSVATLSNAGAITGASNFAVLSSGTIGTLTNSGTFAGTGGIASLVGIGSLSNQAGGRIEGTSFEAVYFAGTVGALSNAAGATIAGNNRGIEIAADTLLTSITNAGTISSADRGINAEVRTTVGTLTNSGTMTGSDFGVVLFGTTGTVANLAGGRIAGTASDAVYVGIGTLSSLTNAGTIEAGRFGVIVENSGTLTSASNTGTIRGTTAGVFVHHSSLIRTLTNTGTVQYTGAGTGPAIRVDPSGILGDSTGASGPAILSTGSGALLDGTIVNSGTIYHGFTIENQSVAVSAGGGSGTFTSGTLTVVDGNLTTTGGTITLDAAISVDGGEGTYTSDGTLRLLGIENVTGNYVQNAGATTLMELLGTGNDQYGRLDVSRSASFAGNLDLGTTGLAGGLADGQTFLLFDFASYAGGFGSLLVDGTSLSNLGGGVWSYGSLLLTEVWTGTSMSLSVTQSPSGVPEIDPTSCGQALAVALGALGLFERRARRLVRRARSG
ncbi:MAG: beta strand repeat-containing protein [Pirellulales bacterium]